MGAKLIVWSMFPVDVVGCGEEDDIGSFGDVGNEDEVDTEVQVILVPSLEAILLFSNIRFGRLIDVDKRNFDHNL